jgi:hypothetical protein
MVLKFFKSEAEERPDDVKGVRHALLQFIKATTAKGGRWRRRQH